MDWSQIEKEFKENVEMYDYLQMDGYAVSQVFNWLKERVEREKEMFNGIAGWEVDGDSIKIVNKKVPQKQKIEEIFLSQSDTRCLCGSGICTYHFSLIEKTAEKVNEIIRKLNK